MTFRHFARAAALALLALAALPSFVGAAERVRFGAAEGDLVLPQGRGPFPAIVVLHSCLGPRADRDALGKQVLPNHLNDRGGRDVLDAAATRQRVG